MIPVDILALPIGPNDVDANTVGAYFAALFQSLWEGHADFIDTCSSGNADWQEPVYAALRDAGLQGRPTQGGDDIETTDALIDAAIRGALVREEAI